MGIVLLILVVLGLLISAFCNRTPSPGGTVVAPLKDNSSSQ
ncbi:MAG: hypothetical protein PHO14_05275 [Kiritimatiellae bacterium]|nr:hypothetical protein [Kiritimatiellia bacterium]